MIGLPSLQALDNSQRVRIWLASEATDMRCGFDRLAERVRAVIGQDPLSGHWFVFRSRHGERLKILTWDRVGNARGGRTAAILASLTSTCRRHDVDPQLYLTQLLMNLPAARMNELSVWLPDQWKQLHTARIAN
jgi:transposase